jgi:hypothetical protein
MTTKARAKSALSMKCSPLMRYLAVFAGTVALVAASLAFTAPAAQADPPGKVAVCHYVPGQGNTPPNWTYIPSMSWEGWLNGHASQHPEDKYGPENGTIADCGTTPPPPPPPPEKKVDICHATNGQAPFMILNVGESATWGTGTSTRCLRAVARPCPHRPM